MALEYQGWAVVRNSASDADLDPNKLRALQDLLASLSSDHRQLGGQFINGEFFTWAFGLSNHKGPDFDDVQRYFSAIAELAPGSYGLLYHRDSESPDRSNSFQVLVLAKGQLQLADDPFLSPCTPIIEDP